MVSRSPSAELKYQRFQQGRHFRSELYKFNSSTLVCKENDIAYKCHRYTSVYIWTKICHYRALRDIAVFGCSMFSLIQNRKYLISYIGLFMSYLCDEFLPELWGPKQSRKPRDPNKVRHAIEGLRSKATWHRVGMNLCPSVNFYQSSEVFQTLRNIKVLNPICKSRILIRVINQNYQN